MLSEKTLSKIRGLGLGVHGYLSVCAIVQEAIDESRPAKQTTCFALILPGDWPADYRELFWEKYPNKKSKKEAMKALDKVAYSGRTRWTDLIGAVKRYIVSRDVQRGFVKHPATWLNAECWKDQEQTTPWLVERPKSFIDAV
jgi:hypothetical protein